jgi:hypothetical protein
MMSRTDRRVLTVALLLWCLGVIGSLLASARNAPLVALTAQLEGGSSPTAEEIRAVSPDDHVGPGLDEAAYAHLPQSAPAR